MGCYDTLVKGRNSVQVKCWNRGLLNYFIGDTVPELASKITTTHNGLESSYCTTTYTICLPSYTVVKYALIKENIFVNLTNSFKKTYAPYIDKFGNEIKTSLAKEW